MTERFRPHGAILALIIKNNKILLIKKSKAHLKGLWLLPSGHIDGNETAKKACAREAKEEANITITDMELKHTMYRFLKPGIEYCDFFFQATKFNGEPKLNEPDKFDDIGWFDLDKLPENMAGFTKQALQHIRGNKIYSEYGFKGN